ncbi:MAG: GtrA family protein [Bacteroidota bacterium]
MILTNSKELGRFLRFALVGAIGAGVDFGVFNLLAWDFHLHEVPASVISFIAAVTSNFLWNRYWTYPDSRSKPLAHQVSQFFLVNLVGLLIRTPIFAGLEDPLGRLFASLHTGAYIQPERLGHNAALAVAIGVVMLWNFFINRHWTYNDVE